MNFNPQKARRLANKAPSGIDIHSRRKYALFAALDRIEDLEADLKQAEVVIQAKMDVIDELQAEGKRALEVIDNQAAEIRDLRERLAGRGAA